MPSKLLRYLRVANHLLCAFACGSLLHLAYLYQTEGAGLHPFLSGLLIGCLIVLAACYPKDDEPCQECGEVNLPAGQTRCSFCDEGEGRVN